MAGSGRTAEEVDVAEQGWTVEGSTGSPGRVEVVVRVNGYDHKVRCEFASGAGPGAMVSSVKGMPIVVVCAGRERPEDRWVVTDEDGSEWPLLAEQVAGLDLSVAVLPAGVKRAVVRCVDSAGVVRFEVKGPGDRGGRRLWPSGRGQVGGRREDPYRRA